MGECVGGGKRKSGRNKVVYVIRVHAVVRCATHSSPVDTRTAAGGDSFFLVQVRILLTGYE